MAIGMGRLQKAVLGSLHDNGGKWFSGCGWKWGGPSETEKLLRTLVTRGYAAETGVSADRYATFEITPDGTARAKKLMSKHAA